MICFHSRYNLGDNHNYEADDLQETVSRKDVVALPLFLYDHSGITISTGSFSCNFDSGQIGYIFIDYEKVRKEYGWKVITQKRRDQITEYLKDEVKSYNNFLTGQIFGFTVEKDGENIHSCWGFDDIDYCMNEAIERIEFEIKDEIKVHLEKVRNWIKNRVPLIYRESCPVQSISL